MDNRLYNNFTGYQNILNMEFLVAIYVRLSKEDYKFDKNNKVEQSESIENQIKFLKGFVKSQGWTIVDIYSDDGYTGTNFNRPEFIRMKNDIEAGKVNLVITKDLSRLGREYIETGFYVEKFFPQKNVRYIAVNDGVDTFDGNNSNNDVTPFKAVLNDMYAKDISKKVRTALVTKAIDGVSIKSFMPYGYKKDMKNKGKIIVDTDVADIIKLIFDMYKSGKSKKMICKYLDEEGIETPLKYKERTSNYANPNKRTYLWSNSTITTILKDRVYIGDLVQHKYSTISYKVKKAVKLDESQYIITENNHEPIIDKDTFKIVQQMLDKQANEWNYTDREPHLLKGLVFCKECGARVTYNKNHGKYFRLVCSKYKKQGKEFCSNINMREDYLIQNVLDSLKKNIKEYLKQDELVINKGNKTNTSKNNEKQKIKDKVTDIEKYIKNLYQDKVEGIIDNDTFSSLLKNYKSEKLNLEMKLNKIEKKETNSNNESNLTKKDMEEIKKYALSYLKFDEKENIDRKILLRLIDKIEVGKDKKITIFYKFKKN